MSVFILTGDRILAVKDDSKKRPLPIKTGVAVFALAWDQRKKEKRPHYLLVAATFSWLIFDCFGFSIFSWGVVFLDRSQNLSSDGADNQ